MAPEILTLRAMAKRLGVSVRWLREEANAGRVPSLPAGKQMLFNPLAVVESLAIAASNENLEEHRCHRKAALH
jgi:hypothetical protein